MACSSLALAAIDSRCDTSVGGVKEVYIGDFGAVTPGTPSSGLIPSLTLAGSPGVKLVIFRFRPGAASMEMNANVDNDNGSSYVETTLAITFTKMESAKRVQMQALLAGGAMAIVKDNNGKFWFLGYDNPVVATSGNVGGTGAAMSDANRYQLTLVDTSMELPYEVKDTAVTNTVVDGL